jgi:hypothetical protein
MGNQKKVKTDCRLTKVTVSREVLNRSKLGATYFYSFGCPLVVILLFLTLKGHVNEAVFLGFLQKLVPYESLTLPVRT